MRLKNSLKLNGKTSSWWVWAVLAVVLGFLHGSLSYSVKCSRGTYFSDGCNHCYCSPTTGITTCDKSVISMCQENPDMINLYATEVKVSKKCPHGSIFKDRNGNSCKCVEESGAVYCSIHNFKKKVTVDEKPSEFSHRHLFSSPVNYPPPVIESEANSYRSRLNEDDQADRDLSRDDYDTGNNSGSSSSGSSSEEESGGGGGNDKNKEKISVETAKNLGLIETADVLDNDESSKGMSMLEYSGKLWGFRKSKLPLSQFRKQIEEVLGTLTYS